MNTHIYIFKTCQMPNVLLRLANLLPVTQISFFPNVSNAF